MDLYGLQPITGFFLSFCSILYYGELCLFLRQQKMNEYDKNDWFACISIVVLYWTQLNTFFFYLCAINQLDFVSVAHLLNISKYWTNLVNKPLFNCMGNTKEATSCFAVTLNTGKQILKTSNSIIIYKHLNNNKQLSPFEFSHFIGNATHINHCTERKFG